MFKMLRTATHLFQLFQLFQLFHNSGLLFPFYTTTILSYYRSCLDILLRVIDRVAHETNGLVVEEVHVLQFKSSLD